MAWKTLGPEGFPLLKFVVQSENPGTCFFSTPGFPILSHEYRPCFSVNRTPAEFCPTDPYWYNPAGVKDCTQTLMFRLQPLTISSLLAGLAKVRYPLTFGGSLMSSWVWRYPLVICYIAIEKGHWNSWFTTKNGDFPQPEGMPVIFRRLWIQREQIHVSS